MKSLYFIISLVLFMAAIAGYVAFIVSNIPHSYVIIG